MPDPSPTPSPPPDRQGGGLVRATLSAIREGTDQVRRADVVGPPPSSRARQFVHGVCLPFVVWRRLLTAPERRRRYWRTVLAQALVTVGIALAFVLTGDRWSRDDESEAAGLRVEARKLRDEAQELRKDADELVEWAGRDDLAPAVVEEVSTAKREAALRDSSDVIDDLSEGVRDIDGMGALIEKTRGDVEGAQAPEAKLRATAAGVDEAARRLEDRAATLEKEQEAGAGAIRWLVHKGLLFWAALASALYSVQLVVLWLSRDFHDAISREASLAVGLEPEDPPMRPRVRLNLHWARKKLRRRWRGALALFTVAPLLWLVTGPLPYAGELRTALTSAWLAYWWVVFTSAKSARAWMEPAQDPWYLRGWTFLTSRVPPFRWALPRAYGRFVRRFTFELYAPATCVELQPYAMAGLALTRFLGNVPVVKLFARPLFPVAAALLVEERRRWSPVPPPVNPSGEAGAASR